MTSPRHTNAHTFQIAGCCHDTVQTIELDHLDVLALNLVRQIFVGLRRTLRSGTGAFTKLLKEAMPQTDSALVLRDMTSLVAEINAARVSHFIYVAPGDRFARSFITPDEKHLVRLLHFLRKGPSAEVQTQLLLLCEGGRPEGVLRYATQATDLLMAGAPSSKVD